MPEAASWLRLRKHLGDTPQLAAWPAGVRPLAFPLADAQAAHAVLDSAFPGLVAAFPDWYGTLTTDSEYDPALCIAAIDAEAQVQGFIQCWTSHFIKDLAVAPAFRRQGIGAALMHHAFFLFASRGAPYVDLKVEIDDQPARCLYARLGMVEVEA